MKKSQAPCHPIPLSIHSRHPLRYRCKICHRTYAARHGEISFGSKLTPQEMLSVLAFLKKGTSIRKTADLTGFSPSTIERCKQKFLRQRLLITLNTPHYEWI